MHCSSFVRATQNIFLQTNLSNWRWSPNNYSFSSQLTKGISELVFHGNSDPDNDHCAFSGIKVGEISTLSFYYSLPEYFHKERLKKDGLALYRKKSTPLFLAQLVKTFPFPGLKITHAFLVPLLSLLHQTTPFFRPDLYVHFNRRITPFRRHEGDG